MGQNQWLKTNLTDFVNCQIFRYCKEIIFLFLVDIKHYYYGNLLYYSFLNYPQDWKVTQVKVEIWLYLVDWTEVRRQVLPSGCACLLEVQDQDIMISVICVPQWVCLSKRVHRVPSPTF